MTLLPSRRTLLLKILVPLAIIAIVIVAALLFRDKPSFSLTPGTEYRYRLSLRSEEFIAGGEGSLLSSAGIGDITTATDLEAHLLLRCVERTDAGYLAAFSLTDPERHDILLNDRPLIPDRLSFDALFDGQTAYAQMASDGTIGELLFSPATPPTFKRLMKNILGEIQFSLRSEGDWTAREHNRRGDYAARYRIERPLFSGTATIDKQWASYLALAPVKTAMGESKVSASFTLVPAADGYCRSLRGTEETAAYDPDGEELYRYNGEVSLSFLRAGPFSTELPSLAKLLETHERAPFSAPVRDGAAEKENLRKMAADLSFDELESLLFKVSAGELSGKEEITTLLRRAHGLLGLHPELSDRVADLCLRDDLHSDARKLILTVLTSHDLPETQAAMRKILNGDTVKRDPAYPMLLQAAGFLAGPDKETAALVQGVLREEHGEKRYAAAYTLGAIVGTMRESGREEEARAHNRELVAQLEQARNGEEQQRLLVALANAGMPENVPVARRYARDGNPETRTAAAMALRKTQTEESERALFELTGDGDRNVQNTALLMLSKYRLDPRHLGELGDRIDGGAITEDNYQMVLNLLAPLRGTQGDTVRDLCRRMLEKGVKDANLAQQIRELME
ncbi:MAG TPA: HEAT repeat domain-containing protein [bacterium]|nr:HEAT repeat domain-containing protein [bacterium]